MGGTRNGGPDCKCGGGTIPGDKMPQDTRRSGSSKVHTMGWMSGVKRSWELAGKGGPKLHEILVDPKTSAIQTGKHNQNPVVDAVTMDLIGSLNIL